MPEMIEVTMTTMPIEMLNGMANSMILPGSDPAKIATVCRACNAEIC
jgi:hypothetical protein